jgi:hypothetical protein
VRYVPGCEIGKFDIRRENPDQRHDIVQIDDGLPEFGLQVLDPAREFGALGDQGSEDVGKRLFRRASLRLSMNGTVARIKNNGSGPLVSLRHNGAVPAPFAPLQASKRPCRLYQ